MGAIIQLELYALVRTRWLDTTLTQTVISPLKFNSSRPPNKRPFFCSKKEEMTMYAYYTNDKVLTIYDNLVGNNANIVYQVKVSGKVEAKKICKEKGAKQ
jgi:hypothetical protein